VRNRKPSRPDAASVERLLRCRGAQEPRNGFNDGCDIDPGDGLIHRCTRHYLSSLFSALDRSGRSAACRSPAPLHVFRFPNVRCPWPDQVVQRSATICRRHGTSVATTYSHDVLLSGAHTAHSYWLEGTPETQATRQRNPGARSG
jgi:hypothetical protein